MAPEGSQPKRKPRENQYIFDLGVRGRKTGLTVADTGIRDEYGLEPMDHLFSSPEKPARNGAASAKRNANATISSEADMDLDETTVPEAEDVFTERKQRTAIRMPPPHSKSPRKTFLQSPARRNPSIGPLSSPIRGTIVVPQGPPDSISVRRRLDFSNEDYASAAESSTRSPQKRADSRVSALEKNSRGTKGGPLKPAFNFDGDYGDPPQEEDEYEAESYHIIDDDNEVAGENTQEVSESEVEPEPEPEPSKKSKGKGKAKESAAPTIPAKKGRPGRKRASDIPVEQSESDPPAKRMRRSLEGPKPAPPAPKPVPKGKVSKTAATKAAKPKAAPRRTNLAPISETDSPAFQRGPPMPRINRGLVILRRETPDGGAGFNKTRSGRNSIKPLAYWKNERIEYSEDENEYYNGGNFVLPRIKGVVRAEDVDEPRPKKSYKPGKAKKRAAAVESEDDDDEIEPWEIEPGRLVGEIRAWDPEDQTGVNADEVEEEIALSATAIVTRDIPGASFRFAKTLTMPFFGSGMVDLPAGAVKKPKNSRKMQMVFFVFYGRVEVTVNDSTFRIGKGGMWQVPRGNFYSITNDYDKPARIFFSQGCELEDAIESQ